MTHEIDVKFECGTGTDAYTVVLSGKNRRVFEKVKDHPHIKGKEGEALVAAILEVIPAGDIPFLRRYKDGLLNDGPKGEAAFQSFFSPPGIDSAEWKGGQLIGSKKFLSSETHYKNGKKNDLADGTAAHQEFNLEGTLILIEHYKDGFLNDAADGTAAVQKFHYLRPDQLVHVEHYKEGSLNDAPDGTPAVQDFDGDGWLWRINHYKDGVLNDTDDGMPADQRFSYGYLNTLRHYKDGKKNDLPDGTPAYQIFIHGRDGLWLFSVAHFKDGNMKDGKDGSPAFQEFNQKGKLIAASRYKKVDDSEGKNLGFLKRRFIGNKEKKRATPPIEKAPYGRQPEF